MSTGKIEYAPDYKSRPDFTRIVDLDHRIQLEDEYVQLRDAVVEAAKTFRRKDGRWSAESDWTLLARALDALIEFEEQSK